MIAFDTPFLGMHPGVISAGIGSLFRPAPEPKRLTPEEEQRVSEQVFGPTPKRNFTIGKPKKGEPDIMIPNSNNARPELTKYSQNISGTLPSVLSPNTTVTLLKQPETTSCPISSSVPALATLWV